MKPLPEKTNIKRGRPSGTKNKPIAPGAKGAGRPPAYHARVLATLAIFLMKDHGADALKAKLTAKDAYEKYFDIRISAQAGRAAREVMVSSLVHEKARYLAVEIGTIRHYISSIANVKKGPVQSPPDIQSLAVRLLKIGRLKPADVQREGLAIKMRVEKATAFLAAYEAPGADRKRLQEEYMNSFQPNAS